MDWGKIRETARQVSPWFIVGWLLLGIGYLIFVVVFFVCPLWLFMLLVRWAEFWHPDIDAPDNWMLPLDYCRRTVVFLFCASMICQIIGLLSMWKKGKT